jgi:two-component system NtrC family sensor kinase
MMVGRWDAAAGRFSFARAVPIPVQMKDSPARRLTTTHTTTARPLAVVDGARRRHVLIVDDEQAVRSVLRRYLERRGWTVMDVANAELALTLIDDPGNRVDAVIVDLHMPGLEGPGLCQRIAAARPALSSRMIVATGDTHTALLALADERLGCPVLAKPFELAELDRALENVLAR